MEHDASDILGHSSLPVARGKNSGPSSFSMGQFVFIGVVLFVIYMVAKRLWKRALLWQERSYKLATRRRHGIPDNDLRPFNVAYSAAMTRAREEESRAQVKSNPLLHSQGRLLHRHSAQPEQALRNRTVPEPKLGAHPETLSPMAFKPTSAQSSAAIPERTKFMNHYVPRQPIAHSAQASSSTAPARPSVGQPAYHHMEDLISDNEGKKRSLDEQEDDHEFKKSRLDGEELIDGDEDAEFFDEGDTAPKRGSKRGFGEEEESEGMSETKKFRGKRARKVSQEKTRQSHAIDDNMDIDDEEVDEVTELRSIACGKKRDRAEAGSTFGGDDEDSAVELEPEDDIKARRRRRKRRTVSKRKSEASHARGKKRDRDSDDERSDQESEDASQGKASRKKRGKRGSDRHDKDHASRSDISMDESIRREVRVIGEEWESNGIKYKVGLNGQRLRQALVKQARQKFVMPIDSQHPDRNANVQICIECWLTEEEYQEKKAEHMLAWQDGTPPRQEGPLNNLSLDITEPPLSQNVAGKNLLWGSSTASTPAASPPSQSPTETPPESAKPRSYRDTYRHSIATTVGLPISPFHNSQIPTMKRIASTTRASLSGLNGPPGLSDSTNGNPRTANKAFSKWEKQELEAQAIMKMREANRKKELEREAKLKKEREEAERVAAEQARLSRERAEKERIEKEKAEAERKAKEAALQVPKITVTAPSSENVTAPPATSMSTNVPNFFSKAPTGSTTAKPVVNTAASGLTSTPFFSNTSASASIPATNFAQAEPSKPQSLFNFSAPTGNSNTGNAVTSYPTHKSSTFSSPATTPSTGGPKAEGSTQSPFSSRIGTQAPVPAPESSNPTPAQPQPSLFGVFSVAKPNNSMNSNHSQTPSAQPNPSATTSSTNAPLKFTFNVPSKSTTPNPPTAASTTALPSAPSSSLIGALGSDQQKTTSSTSTFNFKIPTTPASVSTPANVTSTTPAAATTSTPKFIFGTSALNPSASSSGSEEQNKEPFKSFGNTNTSSANTGTGSSPFGGNIANTSFQTSFGSNAFGKNNSASQGQKSVFGGGNGNTTAFSDNTATGPSPFGGGSTNTTTAFSNNTGTSPSPFGTQSTQTPNIFGRSAFGSNSTETPKSVVFGNGTSTPTSTASAPIANTGNNTTTTPKFSFPVNNSTSTPAATTTTPNGTPSGAFAFAFGQTPTTTTTTTPQSSPFGSSAFGKTAAAGTSSSNTTTKPSIFGGAFGVPAPQQQK